MSAPIFPLQYILPLTVYVFIMSGVYVAASLYFPTGLSEALNGIGCVYRLTGKYRKAIEYLKQAKKLAKATNDKLSEAKVSWNLGLAFIKNGNKKRAIKLMQILVDYETRIGHTNAEKDSRILEDLK